MPVPLLLADENDDFLDGLSAWLTADGRFEVVGVAHSAREALERIDRLGPRLVVLDLRLPDVTGLDAVRRIKARRAAPLVVVLLFHDSTTARLAALAAGADGCVAKFEIARELIPLVEALLALRPLRSDAPIHDRRARRRGAAAEAGE